MRWYCLLLLFCVTQFGYSSDLTISFNHVFDGNKIQVPSEQYITNTEEKVSITKLKYYIGNVKLTYETGVVFVDVTPFHLIDLDKLNSMSFKLVNVPLGVISKLEFGIGVDSLTNAKGLLDGDLDPMNGMYWGWSSGFINFKLEGTCLNCKGDNEFNFHLGGFMSPNQSYQQVVLPMFKKGKTGKEQIKVKVELAAFFKGFYIDKTPRIMSPSIATKRISKKIPSMFNVEK